MNAFRVWVRPLGGACHVRVDGMEKARWLLGCLSQSFIFKSSKPVREVKGTSCCTFQLPYTSQVSRSFIERELARIPEVRLLSEPA